MVDIPFEVIVVHLEQVGRDDLAFARILRPAIAVAAPATGVERDP